MLCLAGNSLNMDILNLIITFERSLPIPYLRAKQIEMDWTSHQENGLVLQTLRSATQTQREQ